MARVRRVTRALLLCHQIIAMVLVPAEAPRAEAARKRYAAIYCGVREFTT